MHHINTFGVTKELSSNLLEATYWEGIKCVVMCIHKKIKIHTGLEQYQNSHYDKALSHSSLNFNEKGILIKFLDTIANAKISIFTVYTTHNTLQKN